MSTEILNLEQKKQAISRGLSPFIAVAGLERILQYWEDVYGHQPTFVLNRFVNDICVTDDLRQIRKEILRQLLSELAELERQVMMRPKSQQGQTSNQINLQLKAAFESFLQRVLAQVKTSDRAEFHEEVLQIAQQELGIMPKGFNDLGHASYLSSISQDHYAPMLTYVYRTYCEFYGPSYADAVYARSKEWIQGEYPTVQLGKLL